MEKLKVLFHINDSARWQRTLTNIRNFIKDVGEGQADIEVVANGAAVSGFYGKCEQGDAAACGIMEKGLAEEMGTLAQQGVHFAACRNALKMHDLLEEQLPSYVGVVPAGITEIIKKQAEGYAYYKA